MLFPPLPRVSSPSSSHVSSLWCVIWHEDPSCMDSCYGVEKRRMLVILLEWISYYHAYAWTKGSFHILTPGNLPSIAHCLLDVLNDELESEIDMIYAYIGWMRCLFIGSLKTMVCNNKLSIKHISNIIKLTNKIVK